MASNFPQDPANIHQDQNLNTVYGFRSYLCKTFSKYSATGTDLSKKRKEKSTDENSSEELSNFTNEEKQNQLPREFDWDDIEYDFSHSKRGLAIIINNDDFSKCSFLPNRLGSDKDASALYNAFRLLGFDVEIFNNLEGWKMFEVLEAANKYYDHRQCDCFVCAVLTHGNVTEEKLEEYHSEEKVHLDLLFGTDGQAVTVKYLTDTFNDTNCSALKDKPRLFFLQACRGRKCDDGQVIVVEPDILLHQEREDDQDVKKMDLAIDLQEDSYSKYDEQLQNLAFDKRDVVEDDASDTNHDVSKEPNDSAGNSIQPGVLYNRTYACWRPLKDLLLHPAPSHKDFLIMYATPPGHTAWRNEQDGSWFIQTLCRVLTFVDLTSVSLIKALTKVSGLVAKDFESQNNEYPHKKGLPVIESKLLKDIFISKKTKETPDDIMK